MNPNNTNIEFRRSSAEEVDPYVYRLRVRAHINNGSLPQFIEGPEWLDEFESCSDHFLATMGSVVVGSARCTVVTSYQSAPYTESLRRFHEPRPLPIAVGTRLVVDPKYQGMGIAKQLDLMRISWARELGVHALVIASRNPSRTHALFSLGFSPLSPEKQFNFDGSVLGQAFILEYSNS